MDNLKFTASELEFSTNVLSVTFRQWLNIFGLALDAHGETKHRRYSIADAFKIAIINAVALEFGQDTGKTIQGINRIGHYLVAFSERFNAASPVEKENLKTFLVWQKDDFAIVESISKLVDLLKRDENVTGIYLQSRFLVVDLAAEITQIRHRLAIQTDGNEGAN